MKGSNKRKRNAQLQAESSVKLDSGSEQDTVTSDETNEVVDNPRAPFKKRKSILQPSGSKFSKKAAGRRRSLPPIDLEVTEQEVEVEAAESGPAEWKTPALPVTDGKQISSHTRSHQPTTEANSALYHEYLPRKYVDVKVVEYDLPSCQPEGPGDLWTCPFDKCNHKVHEASSAAGNAKIKDHFQAHAQEAQEKIDLVYKESRPYLPVEFVLAAPPSPFLLLFCHYPLSTTYLSNKTNITDLYTETSSVASKISSLALICTPAHPPPAVRLPSAASTKITPNPHPNLSLSLTYSPSFYAFFHDTQRIHFEKKIRPCGQREDDHLGWSPGIGVDQGSRCVIHGRKSHCFGAF